MRVLVTGASGQLGAYIVPQLQRVGAEVIAWSGARRGDVSGVALRPVDLADADSVSEAFREARPEAVIHAAALTSVAACHGDPERADRVNIRGTQRLTELADGAGARLAYISTDLVFDGAEGGYREEDSPHPLSVYGRTKSEAEELVLAHPRQAAIRVSLLFGPTRSGRPSFFDQQIVALRQRQPIYLFEDEWRTPLDLATGARAIVEIVRAGYQGLLHVGGPERMSRLEMGVRLAAALQLDPSAIVPTTRDSAPAAEPRPRDTSLNSSLWRRAFPQVPWPTFEEAMGEMLED